MKYLILAALFAGATAPAIAQSDAPLELGIPGEVVRVEPSAFISAEAIGPSLLLQAHPSFTPMIVDFARDAGPDGISLSICGVAHPPFQPTPGAVNGTLHIFLGDAETAGNAAAVLSGHAACADIVETEAAVTIEELLPPPSSGTTTSGLSITSASGTYSAMTEEITSAFATTTSYGSNTITLTFGPALATWLAEQTTTHLNERMSFSVCGVVLTEPIVQEAITTGEMQISGSFSKEETEVIAARIRGDIPCDS